MKKTIVMLASFIAIGLCHAKTEHGDIDSLPCHNNVDRKEGADTVLISPDTIVNFLK